MNDVIRWRQGETDPILVPVPEGLQIDAGTLLYMDNDGMAVPYREFVERGQTIYRGDFDKDIESDIHRRFLGVALSRNTSGYPSAIHVATRGFFEFDLWTKEDRVTMGQDAYLRPIWDGVKWVVSDDSLTTERWTDCFFSPVGRIAESKATTRNQPTPTRIQIHSNIL